MRVQWSGKANADLDRLFDFLATSSASAAERVVRRLLAAPNVLVVNPALGARVENLEEQGVRRLVVSAYEIRYQVVGEVVEILRVFHTRENR
ncbi:MAG: type II toxin-antitoxin system RelE/ParE family toxin [Devosia sp.]